MKKDEEFTCRDFIKDLSEIREFIAEIRVIYESQQKRLDKIESCLFGNGKLGIAQKVAIMVSIANFLILVVSNILVAWLIK